MASESNPLRDEQIEILREIRDPDGRSPELLLKRLDQIEARMNERDR